MDINIIAVGSNQIIAKEIKLVVSRILGGRHGVKAMVTAKVTGREATDLYVCAITQREPLLKVLAPEKLVVLDMRPTAQFFIDISHIPEGEKIYIFNSNACYAKLLSEMCKNYKIENREFITIAYEDMSSEEVKRKLQLAKYIVGVGDIVGKEVLLSEKYVPYLRNDVVIIGRTRMATMQTACNLLEKVHTIQEQLNTKKITALVENLKNVERADIAKYQNIATELEKLIKEKSDAGLTLQMNIINSFAAQLSDKLVPSANPGNNSASVKENQLMAVLEEIKGIASSGKNK